MASGYCILNGTRNGSGHTDNRTTTGHQQYNLQHGRQFFLPCSTPHFTQVQVPKWFTYETEKQRIDAPQSDASWILGSFSQMTLHIFLCTFQSSTWHCRRQYHSFRHLEHRNTAGSPHLPHLGSSGSNDSSLHRTPKHQKNRNHEHTVQDGGSAVNR